MSRLTGKRNSMRVLMGTAALALFAAGAAPMIGSADTAAPVTANAPMGQMVSYADIVAAVKPAVVTVEVTAEMQAAPAAMPGQMPNGPNGMPFDQFFRQFFGQQPGQPGPWKMVPAPNGRDRGQVMRGLGSGFLISSDGTIVTNNHVVDGATSIKVTLDDGSTHDAKVVGRDPKTDIAVLKIDGGGNYPYLQWGDSAKIRVGDPVIAIGNPFGVGTTVTSGILSARGRDIHNGPYDDFLQVDAAINHGNSGGPLIDDTGHVVGVNSAIFSPNDGSVGVGFAIPSDQAKSIVQRLISNGSIERGYLGVQIQPVTPDLANAMGLASDKGALVARVEDGTPAAAAGLKTGDVIVKLGNKDVADARSLSRIVADIAPDSTETLTVMRNGKSETFNVKLAKLPTDQAMASAAPMADGSTAVPELGLNVQPLTPEARQQLGLADNTQGLVVTDVTADGGAAQAGIEPGDVILSVNMEGVTNPTEIEKALGDAQNANRNAVVMQVMRNGNESYVGVPFQKNAG